MLASFMLTSIKMNIFENYTKKSNIFKSKDALLSHYIPDELPGRKKECKFFVELFSDAFQGTKVSNVLVYGEPGSGKTCVIKYVIKHMNEEAKRRNLNNIIYHYINCRINANTEYRVIKNILENEQILKFNKQNKNEGNKDTIIKKIYDETKLEGSPIDKFYEFLERIVREGKINLIVILDEIDALKKLTEKDNLMYKIERINGNLFNNTTNKFDGFISIIAITNDTTFKGKLDSRTRSSLAPKSFMFKSYDASQLEEILKQRRDMAFYENVVKDVAIKYAAAYVAKTHKGDARYALNLLKTAGEIAEEENKTSITEEEIKKACGDTDINMLEEMINQLSDHQKIALYAIADAIYSRKYEKSRLYQQDSKYKEEIFSGEAYEAYCEKCPAFGERARTMRWFREYLSELSEYNLISLDESGKGIRGRTTKISIGSYYSPSEIRTISEKLLNQMYEEDSDDKEDREEDNETNKENKNEIDKEHKESK